MPVQAASRRLLKYAPSLIAALLALAMTLSLMRELRDWMQLQQEPAPADPASNQTAAPRLALERLEPLFGPAITTTTSNGTPPATNLGMTLRGSFVHADPQRSSAIIQRSGNRPQRYTVGDEIQDGIRLHAVYRDRIELERNGRLESLPFPIHGRGRRQVTPAQENPAEEADSAAAAPDEEPAQLRTRLEELRDEDEAETAEPASAEPIEQPTESD